MKEHNFRHQALFYLGLMLIFLPFLQKDIVYFPLFLLALFIIFFVFQKISQTNAVTKLSMKMKYITWKNRKIFALSIVLAALLLPFISSNYMLDIFTYAVLYAILATALNITVGLTGILVLGFIAFYAIGAYTMGLLTAKFGICNFWIALPAAGLIAMQFGILLGIPALRLKGDYLAIVTLGFGEIVKIVLNNLDDLTGGPNGILGIKRPSVFLYTFNSNQSYYYFCLFFLIVTVVIVSRIIKSRYGRTWIAIRENELAANVLGIDVFRKYLLSFSLSAFFGGIAGALFAAKQGFISPESFTFYESVLVLCMVVLGGIGNIAGSLVGACLLIVLPELLREFQLYRMLVFGLIIILFMIFRPQGIVGSEIITMEFREKEKLG